jgi:pimeloyl-ACP methyl ester carboxylesterase
MLVGMPRSAPPPEDLPLAPPPPRALPLRLALALLLAAGCQPPPVQRDLIVMDAPAPPPNPLSGKATPAQYNRIRFLRYRAQADPGAVQAIVVCVPGMPAGAMAYDELARRLVRLSGGRVEVWAVDRRANLLEDLTGMQGAERARDPDLAWRYYDDGQVLDGRRYAGLPSGLDYMSEWGLATAVDDLRAVLALVPAAERRRSVVLVGHSFGAAMVQAFAAWDVDGHPAADELAGLVLMDGGLHHYSTLTETRYLKQGTTYAAGLEQLRAGKEPFISYFGFGLEAFQTVEITAMQAWLEPGRETSNAHITRFATLMFLRQPPRMTAAALVGFALDDASSAFEGMRASCGQPDGPVEPFHSPVTSEPRWRPADSTRLYGWRDYDQVSPREKTSIRVLARVAHEGPTNRIEWFFPGRLLLDTHAVRSLSFSQQDWQWSHGLRANRNAEVDAPVLAVMAGKGIVPSASAHHAYRASLAPAVGAGRPRAGAGRRGGDLSSSGFSELTLGGYAHDDLIHASAPEADRELYRPLLDWVLSNTSGSRRVPLTGVAGE